MTKGKMLGVYGAGGKVRCTYGQKERLSTVKERTNRVHWVRKAGVFAQHLVKTTYVPAIMHGNECMGMSDSHLKQARCTVGTAASPPTKGKNTNMVLLRGGLSWRKTGPHF